VLLSGVLFGNCHVYQGVGAARATVVDGLLYDAMFVTCRRLWPCVLAHALWDFVVCIGPLTRASGGRGSRA
jgi:hypothetical protein